MSDLPVFPDCISPEEMTRYHTGDLEEARVVEIEQHLYTCDFCQGLADEIAELVQAELDAGFALLAQVSPERGRGPRAVLEGLRASWSDHVDRWQRGALAAVRATLSTGEMALSKEGLDAWIGTSGTMLEPVYASARRSLSSEGITSGYRGALPNGARLSMSRRGNSLSVNLDQWPADTPAPALVVVPASGKPAVHTLMPLTPYDFSLKITLAEGETVVLLESMAD